MKIIATRPEAPGAIQLGRQGEPLAARVEVDYSAWADEYSAGAGDAVLHRLKKRKR